MFVSSAFAWVLNSNTQQEAVKRILDAKGFQNAERLSDLQLRARALLGKVRGLTLSEMQDCEECCGFGGAFAVRFGEVSTAIVDRKCESIAATGADAVVGGDLGCLLNIEGRLRRRGDMRTRVLHLAEVLAGAEPV